MTEEKKAAAAPASAPVTEEKRRATDPPAEEKVEEGHQPKFYWAGLPVYECPKCGPKIQYPGENGKQQLVDHLATEHPETKTLVPTGLVGTRGEPIYREVKK